MLSEHVHQQTHEIKTSAESQADPAIQESRKKPTHYQRPPWFSRLFDFVLQQWFLVALGILIAFASQVQVPKAQQEVKRTVTSYLCVSLIFYVYVLPVVPLRSLQS